MGDTIVGQYVSRAESGIGSLNVRSNAFAKLSPFQPDSGGLASLVVEQPWAVWQQLDSNRGPGWSLIALNSSTGERKVLASDHVVSGQLVLPGQAPIPAIRNGIVAWAEPVPPADGTGPSRVVAVDLVSGLRRTVGTGTLSSPVFVGPYLIWGRKTPEGFGFEAANADTLHIADLPGLLPTPRSVAYIAGNKDLLLWTSNQGDELYTFEIATRKLVQFTALPDARHRFQFPVLVGNYGVWYTGSRFSVMDLSTGRAFDINGSATVGDGIIAVARPDAPVVKGQISMSRVSEINVSKLPAMSATDCSPNP